MNLYIDEKTNVELLMKDSEYQMYVAIEELSELQKEICKYLRGRLNRDNLIEEMADVYIILEQLILRFGVCERELQFKIYDKMERTRRNYLE